MILTIALLLSFQLAGLLLVTLFGLPVPGPVMGMVLFLFALMTVNGLLEKRCPSSTFCLLTLPSSSCPPASASSSTLTAFRPNGYRLRPPSSARPSSLWSQPYW